MQGTFDSLAEWNGSAEEAVASQIETFVETLQVHAGGPRGYRLRRIILTNFWLYGEQEFDIPHGRLFLAGENASGKSTVLTAALPLALDGDLRPNRLDTFGGRERHIEYYVLGGTASATPFSHERRTTYIALEFEWCDPDSPPIAQELRQYWENGEREKTRFLTIGLSLAGNANASDRIRPLRFLITDGSRLGYDLHTTFVTGDKKKRAYDQARFKQMLEGHGIICDTQAEYERQVARYLFGFPDVKDFQKLINLLLVLRRPNLSTELSFSRVHDYLKQSLRKISGETTNRVIGTIERIDAIQSEIDRIQEAYNAAERLHRARQGLALVRAQLAACEYIGAQLAEENVQTRVTKLRKELTTADNERKSAEEHIQALQTENHQVSGQIKALEASEGLQVAKQLTSARERLREAEAQMRLQEQSLNATHLSVRENADSLERQLTRFEKMKTESAAHLRELSHTAAEEALWETAAFQLEADLGQFNAISMEAPSMPEVPLAVTSLVGVRSDERIAWLRHLEELHQQREKLETKVQHARALETMRFQELDESRRRFQAIQDRGYEAQQSLDKTLEKFFTTDESTTVQDLAHGLHDLASRMQDLAPQLQGLASTRDVSLAAGLPDLAPTRGATTFRAEDDDSLPDRVVEQFAAALNGYRQVIEKLDRDLTDVADQVQGELDELQLLAGSKMHEVSEAKVLYEQKLAEPEFIPPHPTRRTIARAKLAEHGIAALPLYALLDFVDGIDSESNEAGRIEYMLEDAGLLDALVVVPTQMAAANALLATEDLSDCLLDMSEIGTGMPNENSSDANLRQASDKSYMLRFDTAANEHVNGSDTDWEATTAAILTTIGYRTESSAQGNVGASLAGALMSEDGTWTHGLLTGHAGGGTATYIGKTTRLRVRQRELDEINEKRAKLEEELNWLNNQIAQYEQKWTQVQEEQAKLRKALPNSGLEEISTELSHTRVALNDVRSKYQKARLQTQEARQNFNIVVAQLERESNGIAPLASDPKRVQQALMGAVKLKNQARSVQTQWASLTNSWEEYQKAGEALEKAKTNEANVASLYERVRYQALQVQAEEEELRRVAEFADAEELSERLHTLRERYEALSNELDEAKATYARTDERARNAENHLLEAEAHLKTLQEDRAEKQAHFVSLLAVYPVEQLVEALQIAEAGDCVSAAQDILHSDHKAGPMRESDIPLLKEHLEEEYRSAYNHLSRTFNSEQNLLLDYGPDLDDQGNIHFLNENKSRPVELLEILSERIEMQKMLLDQKERQLFEDFLLQEIAEAIRTHILEAEEWVQQINSVLSGLPMVGEHYALEWKPPADYDLAKLGSHLARHYKLLRKPSQTLTAEETETLMGAFKQEIEAARFRQQEDAGMNFLEALEQVFDYREWFHFAVLVKPIGGQSQRLTDRVAGTRSGAEQLFALYVPLFAALAALYRNASPGAPGLLALDEAFDKVSVANTQRIMEFLVSQDFQWIMTGPQISGTGAKIPACARYTMIHEKGSLVATASASFWSDSQSL